MREQCKTYTRVYGTQYEYKYRFRNVRLKIVILIQIFSDTWFCIRYDLVIEIIFHKICILIFLKFTRFKVST